MSLSESKRSMAWERARALLPPTTLLAMRIGDFLEFFNADAKIVVPVIGTIALTKRAGVPMCGVAYHQEGNMVRALTADGYSVAVSLKGPDDEWFIDRIARSSNPRSWPSSRYEVAVTEVHHYSRTYIVEAESRGQAIEKAERGETVEEADGTLAEIAEREVTSTPKLLP